VLPGYKGGHTCLSYLRSPAELYHATVGVCASNLNGKVFSSQPSQKTCQIINNIQLSGERHEM